jgi:hypothetical protein
VSIQLDKAARDLLTHHGVDWEAHPAFALALLALLAVRPTGHTPEDARALLRAIGPAAGLVVRAPDRARSQDEARQQAARVAITERNRARARALYEATCDDLGVDPGSRSTVTRYLAAARKEKGSSVTDEHVNPRPFNLSKE